MRLNAESSHKRKVLPDPLSEPGTCGLSSSEGYPVAVPGVNLQSETATFEGFIEGEIHAPVS
jgi:hypothetical protein